MLVKYIYPSRLHDSILHSCVYRVYYIVSRTHKPQVQLTRTHQSHRVLQNLHKKKVWTLFDDQTFWAKSLVEKATKLF